MALQCKDTSKLHITVVSNVKNYSLVKINAVYRWLSWLANATAAGEKNMMPNGPKLRLCPKIKITYVIQYTRHLHVLNFDVNLFLQKYLHLEF